MYAAFLRTSLMFEKSHFFRVCLRLFEYRNNLFQFCKVVCVA